MTLAYLLRFGTIVPANLNINRAVMDHDVSVTSGL